MKVLLIAEDFTTDQYIRPIVQEVFKLAGLGTAKVEVCLDPRLGGVTQAMKDENLRAILRRYPMFDVFLLVVDRDGEPGRRQALTALEGRLADALKGHQRFISENAWQEGEVWILAGHEIAARWSEVRAEVNAKERYFEPLAASRGLLDSPGGGRKVLAREAAGRMDRVMQRCPEDLGALRQRLAV